MDDRPSWWLARAGAFTRLEILVGVEVILSVVVVNKAVIGDDGNTWGGLIVAACIPAGLAVATLRHLASRRRRPSDRHPLEPISGGSGARR